MTDYVAHLATEDRLWTVCGEPWQHWQQPREDVPGGPLPVGPVKPPGHGDKVRQCQPCLRIALRSAEANG